MHCVKKLQSATPVMFLRQENTWDPDARYDCPDGFYHASTAQVYKTGLSSKYKQG